MRIIHEVNFPMCPSAGIGINNNHLKLFACTTAPANHPEIMVPASAWDDEVIEIEGDSTLIIDLLENWLRAARSVLSRPPAEPSGNTGELPQPVCNTCLGEKTVQGPAYGSGQSDTFPCPDCSAAQPATEQPRIWRILDRNGVPFATQTTSRATAWHWYRQPDVSGIQYSTDNGETWIDEQAEREGK